MMNISAPFIKRPIGTSLLAAALLMAGALAINFLPVAPLPQVEFPVIQVSAGLPGASPETMASAVATPLERQFGRIAGINQMTSTSQLGSTSIVLQFDLNRNIDAAGRDVQAAINAARSQLPANLPGNPSYRKVNPADAPILILALTSDILTLPKMYDTADSILAQKLAQINGVGQVFVGGGARPAVRAELNPTLLNKLGVGLDTVRTALGSANANRPKGELADPVNAWGIGANDQIFRADQYRKLIVAYKNGAPVRLGDVGDVQDSVEDIHVIGLSSGKPAVLIIIFRQPGANIIQTVDRVREALPLLKSSISPAIDLNVVLDRTVTVRASVADIEFTLLISVVLVILVVFAFLRTFRATLIPSVAVPLSLIGTFGIMYLLGYSLDNLSLMALAISTGFVVDDAIVVLENITRYLEQGMRPVQAAFRGAREIGFTVLSMSTSLVAVFIPILMMGGIVGRLFREFAVTLSAAIAVSLLVSLTTTPTMCAKFLRPLGEEKHGRIYRANERAFDWMLGTYRGSLRWVLRHQPLTMLITLKPLNERKESADRIIARLRKKLAIVPGATLYMQSAQDLTIGGRQSQAQFQYTLQGENLDDLNNWSPRLLQKLRTLPELRDVNTDQQDKGLEAQVIIDRDTAARLGVAAADIDNALYDAFGQRQVSIMYRQLNQYHVVMEVAPEFARSPEALENIYVRASNGTAVPLATFAHFGPSNTPLAVNHQGQYPSVTLSFNLAQNVSLGQATQVIENAERSIGFPSTIKASFQGTAAAFQQSLANEPILILAALATVYIVLGVLYESYIHPITILSTLPSAGVGAILALKLTHNELNVMGLIGIILLIGIVKKNAIMMIDFALETERTAGKNSTDSIYEACILRFRPIMMTTMAAMLGGLPLALGTGTGSELRRPLGITIVGGLIVSQALTLFTTPVVYIYMDRLRLWAGRKRATRSGEAGPITPSPSAAD